MAINDAKRKRVNGRLLYDDAEIDQYRHTGAKLGGYYGLGDGFFVSDQDSFEIELLGRLEHRNAAAMMGGARFRDDRFDGERLRKQRQ